jgi:crotonobetainyl-CoA:carnitine CoA-transferase CaiB-like acyl-CoA transferase
MTGAAAPGPLNGITVVDVTRVLSGPTCTMLLADMGARVIKVEQPGRGDDTRAWGPPFPGGESAYFLSINRNKESVALDFTRAAGSAVLEALIARADVLVENFRPGTLERHGFGYGAVSARHPRLVYGSVSGYGQNGPKRELAGYDMVLQAEGGLMSITGDAGGTPYRLGVAVADIVAGLLAANGIVLALFARERSGAGQLVDVALFDSVISLLSYQAGLTLATGTPAARMGNAHPTIVPYDSFEASDGVLVLSVGNDDQWRRMCRAARLEQLAHDPRFATNPERVRNRDALQPVLARAFRTRRRDEWLAALKAEGVPCGAVRDVAEALADPQVAAREMLQAVEHATAGLVQVLGVPIKLSGTPGSVRTPPPLLGQHTRNVLERDLGLPPGQVDALEREGVVGCR